MATSTGRGIDLALDERLCLALYVASRAMTARYRASLARLGLTYPQYLVMLALWQEGPSSVRQLGEHLSLDSSTLSPLIKRLEALGLVTRARATDDERLVVVSLTPSGRAMRRQAPAVTREMCDAAGLSLSDQTDLARYLHVITENLGGEPPH